MRSKFIIIILTVLLAFALAVPTMILNSPPHDFNGQVSASPMAGQVNMPANLTYEYYFPMSTLSFYNDSIFPGNGISRPHGLFHSSFAKPDMMAYDSLNHDLYISSHSLSSPCIFVVNASTDAIVDKIPISSSMGGGGVIYNDINNEIYVAITPDLGHAGEILVVDPTNNAVIKNINIGEPVFGLAFIPGMNQVMVAQDESSNVTVINCSTNSIYRNVTITGGDYGSNPFQLAYVPAQNTVYVADYGSDKVSLISTTNYTVYDNISGFSEPRGIIYDSVNSEVYVSNSETVAVINTSNREVTKIIGGLGEYGEPAYFAFNPSANQVYFDDQGNNNVWVINATTNKIIDSVSVGLTPMGILYDTAEKALYVSNEGSTTLSIIKPEWSSEPVYPVPIHETGLTMASTWYLNESGNFSSGPITRNTYIAYFSNGTHILSISGPEDYFHLNTVYVTVDGIDSFASVTFASASLVYLSIAIMAVGAFASVAVSHFYGRGSRKKR